MKKKKKKRAASTPFSRAKTLAAQAARSPHKLNEVLDDALQNTKKLPQGGIYKWENLFLMIRLAKAYQKGEFKRIGKPHYLLILSAIIYFVSPDDWIPDDEEFGFLDDIMVINSVAAAVQDELEDFFYWEKNKSKLKVKAPKKKTKPVKKSKKKKKK